MSLNLLYKDKSILLYLQILLKNIFIYMFIYCVFLIFLFKISCFIY